MTSFIQIVAVALGVILLVYGHQIARWRVSLHFSPEELRATIGPSHRRVQQATIITTVVNMVVGAAFIFGGIDGLLT